MWTYGGNEIEVLNSFNYLGVTLNYTGNFNLNTQTLYGKGLKAMSVLVSNLKCYDTKPKLALQLFDSFVSSTIMYGSEVWGFCNSKKLENIHVKFCKTVLGVRQSSSNVAVYGELGRYPIYINICTRIVKYWFKLLNTENIILKAIVDCGVIEAVNGYCNWFANVRDMLSKYGFLEVWLNPFSVNAKQFVIMFKQRLIDEFLQQWYENIESSNVLILYRSVKEKFELESYLEIINSRNLRIALAQIRISAHSLRIQTGRFARDRIERNLRYCEICNSDEIEDEFHFLFKCPAYDSLRKQYIKRYYYNRANMIKCKQLLTSTRYSEIRSLAKYIHEAFKTRKQLLNS